LRQNGPSAPTFARSVYDHDLAPDTAEMLKPGKDRELIGVECVQHSGALVQERLAALNTADGVMRTEPRFPPGLVIDFAAQSTRFSKRGTCNLHQGQQHQVIRRSRQAHHLSHCPQSMRNRLLWPSEWFYIQHQIDAPILLETRRGCADREPWLFVRGSRPAASPCSGG
jgi:hypothetical protein